MNDNIDECMGLLHWRLLEMFQKNCFVVFHLCSLDLVSHSLCPLLTHQFCMPFVLLLVLHPLFLNATRYHKLESLLLQARLRRYQLLLHVAVVVSLPPLFNLINKDLNDKYCTGMSPSIYVCTEWWIRKGDRTHFFFSLSLSLISV